MFMAQAARKSFWRPTANKPRPSFSVRMSTLTSTHAATHMPAHTPAHLSMCMPIRTSCRELGDLGVSHVGIHVYTIPSPITKVIRFQEPNCFAGALGSDVVLQNTTATSHGSLLDAFVDMARHASVCTHVLSSVHARTHVLSSVPRMREQSQLPWIDQPAPT